MRRRDLVVMLGGAMLAQAAALRALAQDSNRLRHIGILMPTAESDPETSDLGAVFRQAMQELGWTGGRNLRVDYLWGDGDARRIATLATQMVSNAPDVILAGGSPVVGPLKRATTTIPIVFISASDAVAQGYVRDLSHPGGNITGFTNFSPDMAEKWLALLRQLDPFMERVAVLYNPATAPYTEWFLRAAQGAPSAVGVKIEAAPVHDDNDLDRAMDTLERGGHGGLMVPSDAFTLTHSQAVVDMAAKHRLPAVYAYRVFAGDGGLVSYGVDLAEQMRLAAKYVDRILSGSNPGDLPVLEPSKFELAINVKTAKSLGLVIPARVLAQADEVIE